MPVALPSQLTKTLALAYNEQQNISVQNPTWFLDSTLNHHFSILPTTEPIGLPKIQYFGIGIKGFKNLDDGQSSAPFIPSGANLNLFEMIPFRCVPITNDLTVEERALYRMRVPKNYAGTDYWCYYLKAFTIVDEEVKIISTDIATEIETELAGLDANNLTPVPTVTTAEGTSEAVTSVTTSTNAILPLTGAEVQEVIDIVYNGDLLKSRISEIGLFSGEDAVVDVGGVSYTEAMYAQLAYHYCSLGNDFSDPSKVENFGVRINSASAFLL